LDAIPYRVYFVRQESSVAKQNTGEAVLIEEGAGVADDPWVHQGELYWVAYMCQNPGCPKNGEDFAFTKHKPGYTINEHGLLKHPPRSGSSRPWERAAFQCPACQSGDFISEFLPKELREQKKKLVEELQRARAREGAKRP
jgi:hypothetical protein